MNNEQIVKNVTRCSLCGGTVDKHQYCFVCRDCNAMGDFNTGIMTDMTCQSIHHIKRLIGEIEKSDTQEIDAPKCLEDFLDKKIEQLEATVENLVVHGFDPQGHYKKLNAYRKVKEEYEAEKQRS